MNFGEKLKKILKEKDISQTDLAKKLNVKHSVVNRWVRGLSNNPQMDTIEKISNVLDVPVNYFINNKNESVENDDKNRYKDNDVISLVMKLIENQNKLIDEKEEKFKEKIKRLESEIACLKK